MKLTRLKEPLAICRLDAGAALPAWAANAPGLVSITRTADEVSVVCAEAVVPAGARHESGWQAFKVEGPLAFGLTGVLASLLEPLARARISIFALSTFDTDYVLVKASQAEAAAQALQSAGHTVATD
ncbi:MAG TPA: ACT domain-containing protein [Lacunisphaera sp.]|nr:ACT domain-containing protein [Lacunisphaera sp.]